MSVSYIPDRVKFILWGRAAGRCEYDGCNEPLWRDDLTKAEFNTAYIAHIVADRPDGPRGDPILSDQLKQAPSNLMLMCDPHHRLIDVHDVDGHSVDRLRAMKHSHERRVELSTAVAAERKSEVLIYGANVGTHTSPACYDTAVRAMAPGRYPAAATALELGMRNSATVDRDAEFWDLEQRQLRRQFGALVRPLLAQNGGAHMSVFGFAPQPLLTLLGFLLSDIPQADVYQLHREPAGWCWREPAPEGSVDFEIVEPSSDGDRVALVFSLSATIVDERIQRVLGDAVAIWRITVADPNNDFLRTRDELALFRQTVRRTLDRIKAQHRAAKVIHVFPAMPVATAVELGRVFMPKADLPLQMYDENRKLNGFAPAILIGGSHEG